MKMKYCYIMYIRVDEESQPGSEYQTTQYKEPRHQYTDSSDTRYRGSKSDSQYTGSIDSQYAGSSDTQFRGPSDARENIFYEKFTSPMKFPVPQRNDQREKLLN